MGERLYIQSQEVLGARVVDPLSGLGTRIRIVCLGLILKDQLCKRYEFRDLGVLEWFFGIDIIRDREQKKLWLCQDSCVEKIIATFHLQDVKPALTPMGIEELVPYEGKTTAQEIYTYQRKVGVRRPTAF